MPWTKIVPGALAQSTTTPGVSPTLTKFVDALPIPGKLPSAASYQVAMTQFRQKLHRDLPATTLWG